ncbi:MULTISPECIES: shikimate dehydrogenase [Methylobacterium]|uniref:shikimate dehydrogenase family protein n=1 Tax=Methylobacterium TaxID=407 RepID=UPI000348D641|nr:MULTISPECIES: shikimate dehydrogenase [Methylobacterium]MBN4093876.1 shikimate dehydrogenase [Methylobacterium sp. OT2]UIN33683.1 shikimate dehydrogenase [Methylobacterium oryzae]SEG11603.1 shikimate dehydrogenase [Methylobacterium sp. 190mf]
MSSAVTAAGITGRTRVYGILADPIYHVKAPEVMGALFARHGVDGVLVPLHVTADGLAAVMDGLRHLRNFGGFIATVPHKTAMTGLCDALTREAEQIGAVNCVRREADGRMVGTMLDGIGFVEALRASGLEPRGRSAALAGAGGAASAIAFALAEAGVARLTILNRTADRAQALAERLRAAYPGLAVAAEGVQAEHDLLVNGTSLGMRPQDAAPFDLGALHAGQFVAEAIMDPEITPLLAAALRAGCRVQKGLPMLECQIALMARHMGAL